MGGCTSRENDDGNDANGLSFFKRRLKDLSGLSSKRSLKTLRYNDSDVILFAFNGDILSIKSAIEKQEIPDVLAIRGICKDITLRPYFKDSVTLYGQSPNENLAGLRVISTKMWNPVLFAIFNDQTQMVKYLISKE